MNDSSTGGGVARSGPALREVDRETGLISFDVIRGVQGGREFYTGMCTFATLYNHFKFNEDPQIPPALRAQRKLRRSRIPAIADYILSNPDSYVFSAITVSVGGQLMFHPVPGLGDAANMGILRMPIDAPILINDGQHRYAAIRQAYEQRPQLRGERIPVVFFEDVGLERSQQMFADLNKHAVKPTKSLGLLYDHRDSFSRFIVNLVNDVEIFVGRTEMEGTNISHRSRKFFTLNGVSEATKFLLKANAKSIAAEKQRAAADFWREVSLSIPEWNLLLQGKVTPHELRKGYVHAHTNVLAAIGMAGHILLTHYPDSWPRMVRRIHKVDWSRSSPQWNGKLVINGRMLKNKTGIKAAAGIILKSCGVKESLDSFGVRW
ncbi:MAG: DNA sulfur modification protein DndB [Nitrosopumilaceae archaeon]|nr:DNA sulfur modification protein DndB [Nitrosopumilaceae archaeon]